MGLFPADEFSRRFREALSTLDGKTPSRSQEPSKVERSLRMSGMGECARRLYYGLLTPPAPSGATWQTLLGYAGQDIVAMGLRAMGYTLVDEEKEVEYEGIPGHIDGLLMGLDLGSSSAVWDAKLRNSFALRDLLRYGLPAGDKVMWVQQQGYLAATKAELGMVTVLPFDLSDSRSRLRQYGMGELDPLINRIVLKPDPETWQIIADRGQELRLCAELKLVPEAEYDPLRDNFPCGYCPFQDRCILQGKDSDFVVTPLPSKWNPD